MPSDRHCSSSPVNETIRHTSLAPEMPIEAWSRESTLKLHFLEDIGVVLILVGV